MLRHAYLPVDIPVDSGTAPCFCRSFPAAFAKVITVFVNKKFPQVYFYFPGYIIFAGRGCVESLSL